MRDEIEMWKEPRMVVLVGVCAAVYAAAMIPFKVLVVFPGLAEVRPAAVLPVVFGFLFGPAGAFGAAFGNLVGDMLGGMLGPGSLFGMAANFAYAYLPYRLWDALGGGEVGAALAAWNGKLPGWVKRPGVVGGMLAAVFAALAVALFALSAAGVLPLGGLIRYRWSGEDVAAGRMATAAVLAALGTVAAGSVVFLVYAPLRYVVSVLAGCLACAGVLAWGVELLGFVAFRLFGPWILIENLLLCLMLGPPLLLLLHPRVARRYMLYQDIMAAEGGGEKAAGSRGWAWVSLLAAAGLMAAGLAITPAQVGEWLGVTTSLELLKGALLAPVAGFLFWSMSRV